MKTTRYRLSTKVGEQLFIDQTKCHRRQISVY